MDTYNENMKELQRLYNIEIELINSIEMTSIGLLDSFGKLEMILDMKDNTKKGFTFLSPVPTKHIVNYLTKTNLIDKATLKKF